MSIGRERRPADIAPSDDFDASQRNEAGAAGFDLVQDEVPHLVHRKSLNYCKVLAFPRHAIECAMESFNMCRRNGRDFYHGAPFGPCWNLACTGSLGATGERRGSERSNLSD